ncbi:MAG: hypothetical protein J5789_06865 [Oscillospiraceae bacterium]|nr:hypothetical protein [Oscillospiraceae bacterium]
MRKMVRLIVRDRFGTTCGSGELRSLREEYIQKAGIAYDRELAAGATRIQAGRRALASVSAMGEELLARQIPKQQRRWKTRMALVVFSALAVLLCLAIFLTHRDLSGAFIECRVCLIALGLQAVGVICLLRKARLKFLPFLCRVFGFLLILPVLNALNVSHYDYRDKLDRIQSIELIEITEVGYHEDELEYRVLRTIEPAEWEGLVDEVARLDFEYFLPIGDAAMKTWSGGPTRLLIRFAPGEDGLCFAIIGDSPAVGETKGTRVEIFASPSTCSGWEDLSEKYGFPVQPQQ